MTFTLTINRERFESHLANVLAKHESAGAHVVPVIKGNGYGFGRTLLAGAVSNLGLDRVCVGTIWEAAEVLENFTGEVIVLEPISTQDDLAFSQWEQLLAEYSPRLLPMVASTDTKKLSSIGVTRAWLDIQTSMHRFGLSVAEAAKAHGGARILMQIAGIGTAKRIVGKDGNPAPLEDFAKVVNVNLIGTYNAARVFAAACAKLDPMEDGERGAMVFTASVAAFDGQVGQQAYSASKAGVAGMTLPMARDLAQHGIRVCTIAPGIFATPLLKTLPEPVQASLAASIPFPSRLGKPEEFAQLAAHIVSNGHLNGEVIRLDGALRMAPR
ncbi:MAG: SDR family oxidoreductase [Betaproteobacteria bacterium]|nr:SDR family oxidoreductase [Betaproteobacteria bacterium]